MTSLASEISSICARARGRVGSLQSLRFVPSLRTFAKIGLKAFAHTRA